MRGNNIPNHIAIVPYQGEDTDIGRARFRAAARSAGNRAPLFGHIVRSVPDAVGYSTQEPAALIVLDGEDLSDIEERLAEVLAAAGEPEHLVAFPDSRRAVRIGGGGRRRGAGTLQTVRRGMGVAQLVSGLAESAFAPADADYLVTAS